MPFNLVLIIYVAVGYSALHWHSRTRTHHYLPRRYPVASSGLFREPDRDVVLPGAPVSIGWRRRNTVSFRFSPGCAAVTDNHRPCLGIHLFGPVSILRRSPHRPGGWLIKKGEMIQVPFYAAFTGDFPGARAAPSPPTDYPHTHLPTIHYPSAPRPSHRHSRSTHAFTRRWFRSCPPHRALSRLI